MSSASDSYPTDAVAGFEALRTRAAVAGLDDRALLVVTGEDRGSFLQGMLSNEVGTLTAGQGAHALLLTEQGRVVADLRVYVLDDEVWLETPRDARTDVRAGLERFIVADDVEMEDGTRVGVVVRGPQAVGIASAVSGEDVANLGEADHRPLDSFGEGGRVMRVSDLGVDAFHFWVAATERDRLFAALESAGATRAAPDALEAQRVVAGIGRLGADYGLDTLAPEVPSLERAISYKKGCYLGQEVVERIAARGKVNWKIVPMRAADVVACGDTVKSAGGDVGHVTSVVRRPDDGTTWVLVRVRTTHAEPGTVLEIVNADGPRAAEVVAPAPEG